MTYELVNSYHFYGVYPRRQFSFDVLSQSLSHYWLRVTFQNTLIHFPSPNHKLYSGQHYKY
jgi:hypothetical protein